MPLSEYRDLEKPGTQSLLSDTDPLPFVLVNPDGRSSVVLVCEHAGRAVPAALGNLGVSSRDMDRHIAFDLGAEALARRLSAALDAALVLQPYSRLVIDCNRPLAAPDAIPSVSDGTSVPGNQGLTEAQRHQRYAEIHQPFHRALSELLDRRQTDGVPSVLVTVHSFTPRLNGVPRDCHLGLLYNRDARLADAIMAVSDRVRHGFRVVRNAPYAVDDLSDYTVPVHGEGRGLAHVLLELRNDLTTTGSGLNGWTALLTEMLTGAIGPAKDAA